MALLPDIALLLLALAGAKEPAPFHPQDGPDVDVRVRVGAAGVRVQIIANLAFADAIVGAPRAEESALQELEVETLRAALFDYFLEELVVEIDGLRVKPVELGFEVQPPDLELLPLFPVFGTRALIKARLSLEYAVQAPPQRARFVWPAFPPDDTQGTELGAPPIEVVAELLAGGESTRVSFTQEEPEFIWQASASTHAERFLAVPEATPLRLPLVSAGLLGFVIASGAYCALSARGRGLRRAWAIAAPLSIAAALTTTGIARVPLPAVLGGRVALPDAAQAIAIFSPLHANIYRAFDHESESEVYDALARSVSGELLDALYTEIHHSLVLQEEGGAVARVQAVKAIETEVLAIGTVPPDGARGFTLRARWRVEGAVFHFGHEHWRTNEYLARYQVRATADGWRISASQVLEALRVEAEPLALPPAEVQEKP